jgi:hypothetical protein
MPFIGKTPETGAFRLIDSITTSATDTYALTVQGDHYFPESARNLIVSLNGVTQAPETAYTVSGSHIVFASALTANDVIDYILVIGDAVDIGTPSDGTVGNAQLKASLDLSGKTLTLANDQISGDVIHGGTISNFASTGIDDNATSTAITIGSGQNVGIGVTNAVAPLHAKGTTDGNLLVRGGSSAASGLTGTALSSVNDAVNATTPLTLEGSEFSFVQSNAVKMRLDASGNLGVGNTNPYTRLHVKKDSDTDYTPIRFVSTEPTALITNTTSGALNYASLAFTTESNGEFGIGAVQNSGNTASDFVFVSRDSGSRAERARITSDGNLLVNTTNKLTSAELSAGETGIALRSGDLLIVSREQGAGVLLNRKTDDGEFIEFRRDGTSKGTIGVYGNDIGFAANGGLVRIRGHSVYREGANGSGLHFTTNAVIPVNENGSVSSNTEDLGLGAYRWKDLYLSGGAYLGGTGSANYLDDYEEGSWTIAAGASIGTISTQRSRLYTKIGRLVNIRIEFTVPSNSNGNQAFFTGLPFNSSNLDVYRDVGVAATTGLSLVTYQLNNSSDFYIYSDSFGAISFAQLSGKTVTCNFTYLAS